MEFLYASGDDYHFMNTETYEQVAISGDDLGQRGPLPDRRTPR